MLNVVLGGDGDGDGGGGGGCCAAAAAAAEYMKTVRLVALFL